MLYTEALGSWHGKLILYVLALLECRTYVQTGPQDIIFEVVKRSCAASSTCLYKHSHMRDLPILTCRWTEEQWTYLGYHMHITERAMQCLWN